MTFVEELFGYGVKFRDLTREQKNKYYREYYKRCSIRTKYRQSRVKWFESIRRDKKTVEDGGVL